MEKVAEPETGFLIPRAWVLGDRFSQLDGKVFDKPTFETFLPHISMLNLGGDHVGIDTSRTSEGLFVPDSPDSRYEYQKKRDIALEEIKDEVDRRWSGMSAEQKNARIDILVACFGTSSKTAIENLSVPVLQEGLKKIRSGMFAGVGESAVAEDAKSNGSHKEVAKKGKAA
jgi:hypothetical protein